MSYGDVERFPVREADYYGGDLVVTRTEGLDDEEAEFSLIWNVWGNYGGVIIQLTLEEMRGLAEACTQAVASEPRA